MGTQYFVTLNLELAATDLDPFSYIKETEVRK